jgi:hypothetical protein
MRRLSLVVAPLVVVAVLAAGCGRPQATVEQLPTGPLSKDEYVHAFEVSAQGLARRYGIHPTSGGGSAAAEERRIAALQRFLRAWADRLSGLRPPAEAARAQARYVAGVRGFATDLDRARAALRRGDTRGAQRLLETGRIVSSRTRSDLAAGRRAFHALGYDINNLDKAPVETP